MTCEICDRLRASLSDWKALHADEVAHHRQTLASLSTAEKERDEALRLVGKAEDAYAGSVICHEILAFMEAAGCGRPGVPNTLWAMTKELIARTRAAEDAATAANKASEVPADSSALEKALGALRAGADALAALRKEIDRMMWWRDGHGDGCVCPECSMSGRLWNWRNRLQTISDSLSGGAHADALKAPKAQKEEEK